MPKTEIGGDVLEYVRTVRDEHGSDTERSRGTGESWVSNGHNVKVGLVSIPLDIVGNRGD